MEPSGYFLIGWCCIAFIICLCVLVASRWFKGLKKGVPWWMEHLLFPALFVVYLISFVLWSLWHWPAHPVSVSEEDHRSPFEFWLLPLVYGLVASFALVLVVVLFREFNEYAANLTGQEKERFAECEGRAVDKTLWVVVAGVISFGYYSKGNILTAAGFLLVNWLAWQFHWNWGWKRKR